MFGDSMTHTPWYRFPFMRFIQLYFQVRYTSNHFSHVLSHSLISATLQVLMKEVGIVQTKHGIAKALFSNAFLTDLVPGISFSCHFFHSYFLFFVVFNVF